MSKQLTIDFYYQNISDFQEMPISSQDSIDNDWELLKKLKKDRSYYALLKCKYCGTLRIGRWHSIIHSKKLRTCTTCNTNCSAQKRVGKTYGSIKVLKLDHIDRVTVDDSTTLRVYYLTKCLKCGKQSIRLYNWNQWHNSEKCKYCSESSITDNPAYNSLWRTYQQGARERNISWELSVDQFLQLVTQNCYYCGETPKYRSKRYGTNLMHTTPVNGIDRLDPSKTYTIDNCVTCCSYCNYMKQAHNKESFLKHIEKIHLYQLNKGSETIEKTSEEDGTE